VTNIVDQNYSSAKDNGYHTITIAHSVHTLSRELKLCFENCELMFSKNNFTTS